LEKERIEKEANAAKEAKAKAEKAIPSELGFV